jgi:hypothetical protein
VDKRSSASLDEVTRGASFAWWRRCGGVGLAGGGSRGASEGSGLLGAAEESWRDFGGRPGGLKARRRMLADAAKGITAKPIRRRETFRAEPIRCTMHCAGPLLMQQPGPV